MTLAMDDAFAAFVVECPDVEVFQVINASGTTGRRQSLGLGRVNV